MSKTILHTLATALLAAVPFLAGCSSSGSTAEPRDPSAGPSLRVTLRDYSSSLRFELASEAHTNRVAYYSQTRADASRKVQTNEVMEALVEELEHQGFEKFAQEGRAPRAGGKAITRSFEVEREGVETHWMVGGGTADAERLRFNECVTQFLQLYNLSASFQTVENALGPEYFQQEQNRAGDARP